MKNKLLMVLLMAVFLANPSLAWAQKKAVNPNSPEDVAELKADAEAGDRGAQYELSMVYTYKQDMENAVKWLTKSAENGYGRAQYTLGNLYYNGSDKVKRNYEKAIQWFESSKETAYKGAKVDELIASAKQKLEEQKKAAEAKQKAAAEAKRKAAAEAKKKAEEAKLQAKLDAERAAKEAADKAEEAAKEAAAKAEDIAEKAADKSGEVATAVAEGSKSIFQRVKDKIMSFFD